MLDVVPGSTEFCSGDRIRNCWGQGTVPSVVPLPVVWQAVTERESPVAPAVSGPERTNLPADPHTQGLRSGVQFGLRTGEPAGPRSYPACR